MWSTINALQLFDEVYFLTKGGPLFSTYVLVYYVFDLAFQKGLAGYAAAVAYTLFAAILVLTVDAARDRAADGALLVMSAIPAQRAGARAADGRAGGGGGSAPGTCCSRRSRS